MRSPLTGLILLLAAAPTISAQAPVRNAGIPTVPAGPGEVSGTVVETESGAPVATASVTLRARRDSAIVAGALVSARGTFRIQGLRPGAYLVRIASLGFRPVMQPLSITEAAPHAALGTVRLTKVAVALSGVAVTAEREAVTLEPDRSAYRAKDVAPAATNASEVLEAVPSVQVDADGRVSYRGNENVAVQINGRPSPMRGAQLAAFLRTLPATVVEKVELIPNPSAKYDPDGMAGILNIVLKQTVDLGLSGGLTASAANRDRYNTSGNVGYQSGPWTTFTSAGFNTDERTVTGVNDRERFRAGAPLSFTNQDVFGRNGNAGVNLASSVEYKANARDVLYAAGTVNRRSSLDASTNNYEELSGTRSLLDAYDRLRDTDARGLYFDATSSFKRTFDARKKHEIAAEVRFNRSHDEDETGLWRQGLAGTPSPATALRVENERQVTDAVQQQAIAQLDYTKTFDGRRKLEAGYKGDARWLDRDFQVGKDLRGDGAWVPSTLSNAFAFDEQVQAVYGVYSHGIGKVDLQGGLRAEYASRDFALAAATTRYPFDYASLFPSANAVYNRSDALQLKASYSRRIRRPGTQELNPFPSFFDVQNVFIGNPALNPEYTDAIEFGLTRSGKLGTLQFAPFYRHTSNIIRVDIDTDARVDGRDVTTVSFRNLATSDSWGADMNGTLRLGKRFTALGGVNVFRMVTDGGSMSSVGSDAVAWMSRVNATAQLTTQTTLQGMYFYRAPTRIERGEFASVQSANFVLRQKLDGEKASVSLRVVDPFNTNRFMIRTGNDDLMQLTLRRPGVRGVFVSYQYNFGRPPRVRPPRQDDGQQGGGFGPPG